MDIKAVDQDIIVTVEKEIYSLDVLHKCFYWYGASFIVDINSKSQAFFEIKLCPKNRENLINDFQSLFEKIKQDILDFKLRDIVTKETQNVRDLLIAKAFAYYDTEENPLTEVSDPVGFDPKGIQ